jgi:hypothetical protein
MNNYNHILAIGEENGRITLIQHLSEVALIAENIAKHLRLDTSIARRGAILHDIGKASSVFQQTLKIIFNGLQDLYFVTSWLLYFSFHFLTNLMKELKGQSMMEIPVSYRTISFRGLEKSTNGSNPSSFHRRHTMKNLGFWLILPNQSFTIFHYDFYKIQQL